MKTMKTLTKPRKTKENKETRGNQDKSGKRHPWHPLREVIIVTMDDQEVWHTYFLFFWEFSIRIILIFKSTFRSFKPPEFFSSRPLWVPTDREQAPHCGPELVDSLSPAILMIRLVTDSGQDHHWSASWLQWGGWIKHLFQNGSHSFAKLFRTDESGGVHLFLIILIIVMIILIMMTGMLSNSAKLPWHHNSNCICCRIFCLVVFLVSPTIKTNMFRPSPASSATLMSSSWPF